MQLISCSIHTPMAKAVPGWLRTLLDPDPDPGFYLTPLIDSNNLSDFLIFMPPFHAIADSVRAFGPSDHPRNLTGGVIDGSQSFTAAELVLSRQDLV